ncbi:hypothetical protein NHQ30_003663 [Ciborinia camelliae]|nr:hypothetical protein NHQ30_003663 [Ciborinia camelliae]
MDYSLPGTPFDASASINYPLPMAPRKNSQNGRPVIQLQDAATFQGQQLGAVLPVKRTLKVTSFCPPLAKVGDCVEVLVHHNVNQVEVENVRTGMTGTIDWEDLLPVPYDGKCGCLSGECRCVYETWKAYSARRPVGLQTQRSVPLYGGQDMSGMYGMHFDFPIMEDWGQIDDFFTNTYSSTVSMPLQMPVPSNPPTQLGIGPDNIGTKTPPEVNDPMTIAGQTPGAILAVKHLPSYPVNFGPILETEVGDRCIYIEAWEEGWGKVKVKNLRTGKEGFLRWESFKPVNTRNTCSCCKGHCYCEYEDFEKSKNYCEFVR